MRICVIAGMIDAKLHSKISPIQAVAEVSQIHLIRINPFTGHKILCHQPPRLLRGFLPLAELWRLLTLVYVALRWRPRVIVAFGVIPNGIYARAIGRLFNIPVIQHVMGKNDLEPVQYGWLTKRPSLSSIKQAAAVAVRGQRTKQALIRQGVEAERIFIPQNTHVFDEFLPAANPQNPQHDLIYVGLLARYKTLNLMIDALALAKRSLPSIRLLLVGDGPERSALMKQVATLGLKDNVSFAGTQAYAELPRFLVDSKAFIMTSQGDGLPMAMIEAMSCGLPAIVSADADIEEVAQHEVNALVVKQPTAETFAKAIIRLLQSEDLYNTLRAGALKLKDEKQVEYSLNYQSDLWRHWLLKCATR